MNPDYPIPARFYDEEGNLVFERTDLPDEVMEVLD